ncbi:TetR/AcrR family transcriptional regulator [Sciscionella marina]|uniref:TetR/AcrR family transcriptional regulator n=1 Tax=Sciscionella marina TaxID=508770 RepID=UPI00037724C2|nr:TetR/AcrR family transcriptional regulator [Sciscionella marina]
MTQQGLRERKKQATRTTIAEHAWRLALEHGMDGITVDGIARAAGVSPRTFFNYFATKEAAIVALVQVSTRQAVEQLRERPAHESLEQAFDAVLEGTAGEASMLGVAEMLGANPGLLPHLHAALEQPGLLMREVIAERTGTKPDELYPAVAAAALAAAYRVAMRYEGPRQRTVLRAAMRQLMHGIAEPLD